MDAIVNTINGNLDLRRGAVSTAIADAGGTSIQNELHQKIKPRWELNPGNIIESGSGKMSCKKIYHTVLDIYDSSGKARKVRARPIINTMVDRSNIWRGLGTKMTLYQS